MILLLLLLLLLSETVAKVRLTSAADRTRGACPQSRRALEETANTTIAITRQLGRYVCQTSQTTDM